MGKKFVALMLALVLCLAIGLPVATAETHTTFVQLPSTMTALNVRSGPGTNFAVAGWAVDGDEIEVVKVGAEWTKITVLRSGKTGYIRNAYIEDLSGPDDPSTGGTATAGRVTGSSVNLRKGPGTGYAKVTALARGTKLRLWNDEGNWFFVTTLSGTKGWISKTYVATGYDMVTSANVNIRKSANGTIIKTLAKGTKVEVISITGNWSKVKAGSTTGYVYNDYLK